MGIESGRNLVMLFSVKKVHVEGFFSYGVQERGLCWTSHAYMKKLRVSLIVPSGRIAFICCVTCVTAGGRVSSCGNLHSLVSVSLWPVNTVFPSLFACTVCFVNVNVHPLSHSTGMEMRGS